MALFVATALVAWVVVGHFDHIGEATSATPRATPADTSLPARNDHAAGADNSSAPLDEAGGLITGPQGLRTATTASIIDNRVFLVGDSVLQGAAPYVPEKLSTWSIIADTRVGRFLDEAIKVVKQHSPKDLGKIVVLNLGNNYGGDQVIFQAQVEEMLNLLSGVDHVLWVNMGEFEKVQREVNDVLRRELLTHPNLTLLDWDTLWKAEPGYTGNDHLHLTPDGADAYAALIAEGVTRVAAAAKETPAPYPKSAKLTTKGQIPIATIPRKRSSTSATSTTASDRTETPSTTDHVSPSTTGGAPPSSSILSPSTTAPSPPTTLH